MSDTLFPYLTLFRSVEVSIFENGTEPQFRVFPTQGGKPVDPKTVQLAITLTRLGGDIDRFSFRPQDRFLAGQGVVTEPHSFDVEVVARSEEHTSELQSLMRISYAVFCLKKKKTQQK